MARRPRPQYRVAGLEPVGGKSRRWRVVSTGKEISYNGGRKIIQSQSAGHASAVSRFERALAHTNNVETAQREAGMSKRGLAAYREQFEKSRPQISPFSKQKGKWVFRGLQGKTHTFLSMQTGRPVHAPVSGHTQIAMQDYRSAVDMNSQIVMDNWLKQHPSGIVDDNGVRHFPETDLKRIKAIKDRMSPRERDRFVRDVHYAAAEEKAAA